jgi:hypothetical protein
MADKLVLKTAQLKVNNTTLTAFDGTDLSSYLDNIVLNANIEEQDGTAFSDGAKNTEAGLEDNTLQLNFKEALAISALDGVLWPLRATKIFVAFRLKNAAKGVDNPEYQLKVLVAGSYPVGGQVGQVATKSLTWRVITVVTRATA